MIIDRFIWKRTMNKKIIWTVIGLIFCALAYFYVSPYIVLNNIKNAAQAGDSEKVSQYIDYSSVRQSLKDQINTDMLQDMRDEQDHFSGWGQMLASTLLDKIVDVVVTPEGMTMVLQGQGLKEVDQDKSQETADVKRQDKPEYKAGYTSWQNFEVQIQAPESSKVFKVMMVRDGLSWKVHKIIVPLR